MFKIIYHKGGARRGGWRSCLLLLALLFAWLPLAAPAAGADPPPAPGVQVTSHAGGIFLEWRNEHPAARTTSAATPRPDLPLVEIGGARLPAHLVALAFPHDDGEAITPEIYDLEAHPAGREGREVIETAAVVVPRTVAGEQRPALAHARMQRLPAAPVVVVREGRIRGERVAVVALSPLFEQKGALWVASRMGATIPGAVLLAEGTPAAASLLTAWPGPLEWDSTPFLASSTAPLNPLAAGAAIKVYVTEEGMQRIGGEALVAAGLDLATLPVSHLHLWHRGRAVALEEWGTADGTLDAGDELRFYAPSAGDRWNRGETYWLTVEPTAGPRMVVRDISPGAAPLRTTAHELGATRGVSIYDSLLPGADGDHWFAADLRTGPGQSAATVTVALTPTLPLAPGSTVITLTGSAYTSGTHRLEVQMGAAASTVQWEGTGAWTRTLALEANAPVVQVRLLPGATPSGVALDSLAWDRPVALDAAGGGVSFRGEAGQWRYQLAAIPASSALYDVSAPALPQRLFAAPDPAAPLTLTFEDGPAARRYVLAGVSTLHTPTVAAHQPVDLAAPLNAAVVYIAPASFHAALAPLVAHRQAQGYSVVLVDVQAIYDTWSYGQVSPVAIRSFLRHAAAAWNPAPLAVVLVGDGSADPHNYTRGTNINAIPPYLAMVDPRVGETACETCYAQLDGDDPLDDSLPDVALGRLPVKSAAELEALIAKIVGYETAADGGLWRARALYVADNYRNAAGEAEPGNDFAALAEMGVALQPAGVSIARVYYDPSSAHSESPWREPDAARARDKTFAALSAGAATVTYVGHSHYWQWAVTDLASEKPYLLGLYDVDRLTNGERLPVVLEMTCLTGAFQYPSRSGTTIDERLVLHPGGGAVAVWGPTGFGVAHGHDMLQLGFHRALWGQPAPETTLGALTIAGLFTLFSEGTCCQDALRTYALLGDPMTAARVATAERTFLPLVVRP